MTSITLTGVGGPPTGVPQANGYYFISTVNAVPPLPDSPFWIASTVFSDGVSPDHTTYMGTSKDDSATQYLHVMYFRTVAVTFLSYLLTAANKGLLDGDVSISADGTAWAAYDTLVKPDNDGVLTFTDYSKNPVDQVGVAVCVSLRDTIGASGTPPCEIRVYEFLHTFS